MAGEIEDKLALPPISHIGVVVKDVERTVNSYYVPEAKDDIWRM